MPRIGKLAPAIGRRFSAELRETSDIGGIGESDARTRLAEWPARRRARSATTRSRTVPRPFRAAFPPGQPCPSASSSRSDVCECLVVTRGPRPCMLTIPGAHDRQFDRCDAGQSSSTDRRQGVLRRDLARPRPGGARDRRRAGTQGAPRSGERLEAGTGERISALEGIGESVRAEREREHGKDGKALPGVERPCPGAAAPPSPEREIEPSMSRRKAPEHEPPAGGKRVEMDLGL